MPAVPFDEKRNADIQWRRRLLAGQRFQQIRVGEGFHHIPRRSWLEFALGRNTQRLSRASTSVVTFSGRPAPIFTSR